MNKLFNKFLSLFVVFLLLFSSATLTLAESGSTEDSDDGTLSSDDSTKDSDDDLDDIKDEDELEIESEVELEDKTEDETELEDESEDELEDELEDESEDLDDDSIKTTMSGSGPSAPCEKVLYVERKLFKLNGELIEESEAGNDDKVAEIKSEIESLRKTLVEAKTLCVKARPVATAVMARNCAVSEDLKDSLIAVKKEYVAAIESKDFENAKVLREKAARIDLAIKEERLSCASETVSVIKDRVAEKCEIPAELYDKLERSQNRISELEKIGTEIPVDLKKDIAELEDKIAERKAKCNALKVTSDVKESEVRDYYEKRLSEALDNEDEDTKIRELRELRKEIDESIKNLIEQRRKLKFSEVDGLVDEVRFKAKSTSVGDSETTEDVEVEIEVEDSTVTIESGDDEVLLSEDGTEFTADDVTVDENGIYIGGVLVKKLPSDVFENNKNLERNAKRIVKMKLEQDGEKIVYRTEYESRRKLFGIIGVNAKNDVTTDAETGDTISEGKPWWNGLSSEVEEDVESEDSTEDDSTETESEVVEATV